MKAPLMTTIDSDRGKHVNGSSVYGFLSGNQFQFQSFVPTPSCPNPFSQGDNHSDGYSVWWAHIMYGILVSRCDRCDGGRNNGTTNRLLGTQLFSSAQCPRRRLTQTHKHATWQRQLKSLVSTGIAQTESGNVENDSMSPIFHHTTL